MAAQGHDAAAGTAHISKQQLDDRCRTNALDTGRVLGPSDGIAESAGLLTPGVLGQRVGYFQKQRRRNAASCFHHLGRIAREVPLQNLEHAARMLQGWVGVFRLNRLPLNWLRVGLARLPFTAGRRGINSFIHPCLRVVLTLLRVPTAKDPIQVL